MTPALREQVRQRAKDCCEYCQMPQSCTRLPHEADHIRAQKHKSPTKLTNMCWACALCNGHKGSDASAYIPDTDELVRLFNPRVDEWHDHFEWDGPELHGKTGIAQATIELLKINSETRVSHRRMLIEVGEFPPDLND
ncbi:MAG: HNH endonuclease [Planctomycetes bacterium]|nr:HNH endonuclease [Planctomycetota bacterium]